MCCVTCASVDVIRARRTGSGISVPSLAPGARARLCGFTTKVGGGVGWRARLASSIFFSSPLSFRRLPNLSPSLALVSLADRRRVAMVVARTTAALAPPCLDGTAPGFRDDPRQLTQKNPFLPHPDPRAARLDAADVLIPPLGDPSRRSSRRRSSARLRLSARSSVRMRTPLRSSCSRCQDVKICGARAWS